MCKQESQIYLYGIIGSRHSKPWSDVNYRRIWMNQRGSLLIIDTRENIRSTFNKKRWVFKTYFIYLNLSENKLLWSNNGARSIPKNSVIF